MSALSSRALLRLRRARSRGYTVVEVLSAMTLFAIGAAGVISMQRVTIQGGDDARRLDVATNIAHEWTTRLQRDAAFWTKPNPRDTATNNIDDTEWLKDAKPDGVMTPWITPNQAGGVFGHSGDFDLFGRDSPPTSGDHIFCAQYRLQFIAPPGPNGAAPPFYPQGGLIRAEVRVYWARLDNPAIGKCEAADPPPWTDSNTLGDDTYYHYVYASTAVRTNALP